MTVQGGSNRQRSGGIPLVRVFQVVFNQFESFRLFLISHQADLCAELVIILVFHVVSRIQGRVAAISQRICSSENGLIKVYLLMRTIDELQLHGRVHRQPVFFPCNFNQVIFSAV